VASFLLLLELAEIRSFLPFRWGKLNIVYAQRLFRPQGRDWAVAVALKNRARRNPRVLRRAGSCGGILTRRALSRRRLIWINPRHDAEAQNLTRDPLSDRNARVRG